MSSETTDNTTHSPPGETSFEAGEITIDENLADDDSAYGDSINDDTQTLTSSALRFKWEHGRRYHAYGHGEYWGPNDQTQLDTEDFVHSMYLTILGGRLYLAPLRRDIHRALDVGCGAGVWTIEFAIEHPSAEVVGVDLSPVQPTLLPANCHFEIDDINLDWTWPTEHFDYIHVRMLSGSVPDWVEFYQKAIRHLTPGGWAEQMEIGTIAKSDDGTVTPDLPYGLWAGIFEELGRRSGKTFNAWKIARGAMEEAGFVNIREIRLKLPIGRWPKDVEMKLWGVWNRKFLNDAIEGFALRGMTTHLGWSYEDTQVFLDDVRKALRNPNVHAYIDMTVCYGQKPMDSGQPSHPEPSAQG